MTGFAQMRMTEHRDQDDLLTAGLGLAGLQAMAPPGFADAAHPRAAELRRRAIWSSWRGIADLSPAGGYGKVYGTTAAVPGREYAALAWVAGARQPHRVLAQVPDAFDSRRRCVVVAPASGSRGIYGAIAVAGPWALPKGCAVAYTDKGGGSDYVDLDTGLGVQLDGTLAALGTPGLAFSPDMSAGHGASGLAFKHAHSRDNPEADWGRHVQQAAAFALQALDRAFPEQAPFTFDNTRVIAVGISNGGGAVLRAAELDGDWLDAVVAGEPNVQAAGGRPLYDFATEAALLMPCALLDLPPQALPQPPLRAQAEPGWRARCDQLAAIGWLDGRDTAARAADARAQLHAAGWTDAALTAGTLSVGFDLWRTVAAAYASAYGRYGVGEHPCGLSYAVSDPAQSSALQSTWWADGSGIPPGNGIVLVDPAAQGADPALAGLRCLRALFTGDGPDAARVRAGVAATRASLPRERLPVLVLHGTDDGLIPPVFTSAPYVAAAHAAGRTRVRSWEIEHGEHFDAFLGFPAYGARYAPMLPYVYAALDRVMAVLEEGAAMPADARIPARGRGQAAVDRSQLPMPD